MFGKQKKSIILGFCTFFILSFALGIFIKHLDENIYLVLADTKQSLLWMLLAFSLVIILIDAIIYKVAFQNLLTTFSIWDGIKLTGIRIFGAIAFFAGGTLSVQSYFLYKKGIMP